MWAWLPGNVERPVTAVESFYAHGHMLFGGPYGCRIANAMPGLSEGKRKHLVGNGYHLPSMMSWQLYVLSHLIHLSEVRVSPSRNLDLGGEEFEEDKSIASAESDNVVEKVLPFHEAEADDEGEAEPEPGVAEAEGPGSDEEAEGSDSDKEAEGPDDAEAEGPDSDQEASPEPDVEVEVEPVEAEEP
jgi:hypothetical protein